MDATILRRLVGEPKQRRFATIDIEARKWVEPYAVGFYDGDEYVDFVDYTYSYKSVDAALAYVLRPAYAGMWIYAHNGGNYDFTFLLRRLLLNPEIKKRFAIDIIPIGSTVISFTVMEIDFGVHKKECENTARCRGCAAKKTNDRKQEWTFVDSVRLMPMTLDEIGGVFKTTRKVKLTMSYDELAKQNNEKTMRHYLRVDCISLHDALVRMQTTINNLGGQIGLTLPSTSMDLFRRKFQKDDIATNRHWLSCPNHGQPVVRNSKPETCPGSSEDKKVFACLHEFIRGAYFGGRTEIYRMQFEPYRDEAGEFVTRAILYDINSHYPHCMLEPMPIGQAIEMEGMAERDVYDNARRMMGVVECEVEIPEDTYLPCLPVEHNGKLMFPTGKLKGTWDASELMLLPRVGGRIVRTFKSVWFETAPIFTRFIRQLYRFRDKRDPNWNEGLDWIAKLLCNSNYGKWAMKEIRTKILIHPTSPLGKKCINFDADVWSEEAIVSPLYIIPQLSVHVTALARARLWEINSSVLAAGGRIYYSDTDSLIVSGATLETGADLGALKCEAVIKRAVFALPKLYMIETEETQKRKTKERNIKVKAKGMGPGIRMACPIDCPLEHDHIGEEEGDDPLAGQLSEKEFFDLVRKGLPIMRHRITKLREALNDFTRKSLEFPRIIGAPKEMQSLYDKRIIQDDYNTSPISLSMF